MLMLVIDSLLPIGLYNWKQVDLANSRSNVKVDSCFVARC